MSGGGGSGGRGLVGEGDAEANQYHGGVRGVRGRGGGGGGGRGLEAPGTTTHARHLASAARSTAASSTTVSKERTDKRARRRQPTPPPPTPPHPPPHPAVCTVRACGVEEGWGDVNTKRPSGATVHIATAIASAAPDVAEIAASRFWQNGAAREVKRDGEIWGEMGKCDIW